MILENRVAIVTGAGSGIGLAGATAMAREGAHIIIADLSPERSEAAAAAIRANGLSAEAKTTDVSDDYALARLIEGTIAVYGRLDILHSHAGIQVEGTLESVDPTGMDASWRLNVRAHFLAARLAMPTMRTQGSGSIIVTSSNSGVFYDHEMVAYTTSKHAGDRHGPPGRDRLRQTRRAHQRPLPRLGRHPIQRPLYSPDGRPRRDRRLRPRQNPARPLGQPRTKSPKQSSSSPPTAPHS